MHYKKWITQGQGKEQCLDSWVHEMENTWFQIHNKLCILNPYRYNILTPYCLCKTYLHIYIYSIRSGIVGCWVDPVSGQWERNPSCVIRSEEEKRASVTDSSPLFGSNNCWNKSVWLSCGLYWLSLHPWISIYPTCFRVIGFAFVER